MEEGSSRVSENSNSTWLCIRARAYMCMCVYVCMYERGNDSAKREDIGSRLRRGSLLYFEKAERFSLVFPV